MKKKCVLFLFVVLASSGMFTNVHADIPALERAALIALYNSTDGDNWSNNSGWKTPPLHTDGFAMLGTENGWYGVICDARNRNVNEIRLHSNQLSGSIPSELGSLANLTALYLNFNQLTGSIPPELGNLANLIGFYLKDNQLTGSIPPELGNLVNLEYLWLDFNQLTGSIPPELGNITYLAHLYLKDNQLTGSIPPELGNLANLTALLLNNNQLTGSIPSELEDLIDLLILFLNFNQLTGSIPPELETLVNLMYLWLDSNQLIGSMPVELMNLTTLLDNSSDFCDNDLYTDNDTLRDFLNTKQIGGDWESCQNSVDLPSYAGAFGSIISETNYNRFCDVDRDGDVDGNDLGKFAEVIWGIIAD